jgi:hypothetical protein
VAALLLFLLLAAGGFALFQRMQASLLPMP